MSNSQIAQLRPITLRYLLLIGTIVAVVTAVAQTGREPQESRILIDGALEPDQIPDWILWNEIFRIAALHSEKSPERGRELWMEKLHLPQSAMNEVIQHGFENRELHAAAERETCQVISESRGESNKERVRVKLRKTQGFVEAQTLEMRDKLRSRIGEDAFLRLQSYARLQIAPRIKIGN